jgi:hypothetical protein
MATILPTGETTFLDANGTPLAGGTVTFYIPGTTTPKDTWRNSGQSILNSNPVTLDSGGRAVIYGSGAYRQVVADRLGNLIWDQETSEPNAGSVSFGGTSAGTANAQTLSAAQFSFLDGQIISFVAGVTNTGSMTISIGGGSPIPIMKNGTSGPVNLVANDIVAGNSYFIQYSKTLAAFQLLLSVAPTLPTGAFLKGYLFGLTLSNSASDLVNNIDVAVGSSASDSATAVLMTNSIVFTKKLNVNWAVGTGNGMLDTGSVANGTYHIFEIMRSDTGNVDFLASASVNAPTLPANYDQKRRIGSILREAGSIVIFNQVGDVFNRTAVQTIASVGNYLPILTAFNVPLGIVVQVMFSSLMQVNANSNVAFNVGSAWKGTSDVIMTQITTPGAAGVATQAATIFSGIFSNTSGQIYTSRAVGSGSAASHSVNTNGWVDTRGRV